MRGRVPEMEYVFCDTDKELPETYDYLLKVEAYPGAKPDRAAVRRAGLRPLAHPCSTVTSLHSRMQLVYETSESYSRL